MVLQEKDSDAFTAILSILQSHSEIEKYELTGNRCCPSQGLRSIQAGTKFIETARKSSSLPKSMKYFFCWQPIKGMCLHTAKSTRRCGETSRLAMKTTPSAFTSVTYGRSYIRQLTILPLPFDLSGKSDIALRYRQRNNSQQSDSFRLLFFFFALYNSIFVVFFVALKNILSYRVEMQRTQINNYYRNQITRLNIDDLIQLCTVLNCVIDNLLDFVSPEEENKSNL